MKKKNILLFVIIVALAIIAAFDYKNRNDISNIIHELDYGYEDFCSKEFLDTIDSKVYTVFDSFNKKQKLVSMLKDNSCYKHNGITPTVYVYTKDNYGFDLSKDDGYVDAEVVFIDSEGKQTVDYEAKIKIRGNSTSTAPKKPFNIKFSEKKDLLGFGEAKKWNLLADCFDPTLMRNKLFLDLGLELGLDNTSSTQYTELYIDGMYGGCYLLSEAVEVGDNRVDIDVNNGDFLLEYEMEREEEGVTYITTEHGLRFAMSDPEEPNDEQLERITSIIDEFDKCLFSNDYSQLEEMLDIDSFVKVYLLNEFAKTVDFGYSSVYFYYENNMIHAGPVWDFDLSSGNYSKGDENKKNNYWIKENGELVSHTELFCRRMNALYNKLLSYPEVNEKYKDLLNEKYNTFKSTYEKNGYIDQLLKTYGWLFEQNYLDISEGGAGWIVNTLYTNVQHTPFSTYQENVDYLTTWLENRLNWLKENS